MSHHSWAGDSENGEIVEPHEVNGMEMDDAVVQEKKIPIKLFVGQIPKIW